MKKRQIAIAAAGLLLLTGCANGSGGREVHTLYPGNGTYAPQTVYVTLPPETVYVTVPVTVTDEPEQSATVEPDATSSPETAEQTSVETAPQSGISYEISETVKKLDNAGKSTATLRYPKLSGLASATVEEKINTLLYQMTEVDFTTSEYTKDYAEKIAAGVTVKYEVTDCAVTLASSALICVRWRAEYTSSDAAETVRLAFARVLNPSTGKEIKPKDIFTDFPKILDMISAGQAVRSAVTEGFDSRNDLSSLIANYKTRVAYSVYPPVCFTADSLIVVLQSDGAAGGWAEYTFPLDSVRGYLKVTP